MLQDLAHRGAKLLERTWLSECASGPKLGRDVEKIQGSHLTTASNRDDLYLRRFLAQHPDGF
jgi:hypothetical protein